MSTAAALTTVPNALVWPLNLVAQENRGIGPEMIQTHGQTLKIWMAALLGQGTFGTVFAGTLGQERIAAKLFATVVTQDQKQDLDNEANRWATLDHPHVLPYRGKYSLGFGQVALLSPYMENGNMTMFIENNPGEDRLRLVAEGLSYLHTKANIAHGDLKSANVLISGDRTVKLADFGLSTFVMKLEAADPTRTEVRVRRTVPFAAPELFEDKAISLTSDTGKLIKRSKTMTTDVYAFGMLIYEVITGATPWNGLSPFEIAANVLAGTRPERTKQFSDDLWKLCEECWAQKPGARPGITSVRDTLSRLASTAH